MSLKNFLIVFLTDVLNILGLIFLGDLPVNEQFIL